VILVNGTAGYQASFALNGSTPALVPTNGVGQDAYYLDGSLLSLYDISASPNLITTELVKSDLSLIYESGLWRDQLYHGNTMVSVGSSSTGMNGIASTFFTQTPPGGYAGNENKWGGTPQTVLGLLNTFMNGYASWAAVNPCFSYYGSGNTTASKYPPTMEMQDALDWFGKGGAVVP
jgi:hypothetical protein